MKLDDYAYSSKLAEEAPGSKLLFGVIPLLFCLLADSFLVNMIVLVLMGALSVGCTQITVFKYLKLMMIPFSFLLVGTLTVVISKFPIGHQVLLGISVGEAVWGIDMDSFMYGLHLVFRALAAVSCMYFISLNTTMHDLLMFFRRWKCPIILVSLMELIYRYVFVLLDEAGRIKTAQSSRLGYHTFRSSIQSAGTLFASLFLRAYLRCDRVYSALESRGYQGNINMLPKTYRKRKSWYAAAVGMILLLGIAAIAERRFFPF